MVEDRAPDCVIEAARGGLPTYLEQIPIGEASLFGFASSTALDQAGRAPAFGDPLRLRTIPPEALRGYTPGRHVADLLHDMPLWYVPLLDNGRIIAFVVVENSELFPCQAVSFGYQRLAEQLGPVMAAHSRQESAVLVAVHQAQEHFLAFPVSTPDRLYSLQRRPPTAGRIVNPGVSTPEVTALDNGEESALDAVVNRLLPVVEGNLRQGEAMP